MSHKHNERFDALLFWAALVACAALAAGYSRTADAQTYPYFKPANGVLKGSTATYVTTPAVSSDIRALWSGTCNSGTFLRGDGSCAASGAGTVTSVGLTMPSGFSVAGSPVTTSGTLAITTTLSGPLKGTGSAFTAAAAADMIGLWSGTCNSTTFLRADGSCQSATSVSGANPTASTGLAAVNGVATTYLRSDGSPALSQAISPTWTGTHSYTAPAASSAISVTGAANAYATLLTASATSSQSFGAAISAGTNSSDVALLVRNQAASKNFLLINGNAAMTFGNATDNPTYTFAGSGALSGVGSGLTSLNATNISSGSLADARLSANVPLLNANNIFLGSNNGSVSTTMRNSSTGTSAFYQSLIYNDSSHGIQSGTTGSNYSSNAVVNGPTGESSFITTVGSIPLSIGTGVTERIRISGTGASIDLKATAVTVNSTAICLSNGTNCPVGTAYLAFGKFTVSGSSCSAAGGGSGNISSCTYTSAGQVTVGFSLTATTGWVCTASSLTNGNPSVMRVSGGTTSAVTVYAYLSGTLTNTDFTLTCMGQ